MPKITNIAEFLKSKESANYEAMIEKDALGRRLLLGFKRKSKRSRKSREVYLTSGPIVLDEVLAEHAKLKKQIAQQELAAADAGVGANPAGVQPTDDAVAPA